MTYSTDGRCHNAESGTFNHECGNPVTWVGTTADGFSSGFCDKCKRSGTEARNKVRWVPVVPAVVSFRALAIASHGITLTINAAGDMLTVTSPTPIPGRTMVLCHELAAEFGAGITFEGAIQ